MENLKKLKVIIKKLQKYDTDTYYEIALMYYYNINKEKGIKKFKEVYERYKIRDAAKMLGYIAYKKNDMVEAKEWYTKSSEDGEAMHHNLMWIYYDKNDKSNARKWAENILNGIATENLTFVLKREVIEILDEVK
ncbi:hypothetical protein EII29_00390 [Leptotrichia sp. OH3620_COT-345]|nr:hypothetical protein EII29_00390 [Leptotrichia sp. OH3620_COT-345]